MYVRDAIWMPSGGVPPYAKITREAEEEEREKRDPREKLVEKEEEHDLCACLTTFCRNC